MKIRKWGTALALVFGIAILGCSTLSYAEGEVQDTDRIADGVYIEDIHVGGMTIEEARLAVDEYIAEIGKNTITVMTDGQSAIARMNDLGVVCANPEIFEEAALLGKGGNLIQRYKDLQDLKHEKHVFNLEYTADDEKILEFVTEEVSECNRKVVEPGLKRVDGQFVTTPSATGIEVNVNDTAAEIKAAVEGWRGKNLEITSVSEITRPQHEESELMVVQDVLGTWNSKYNWRNEGRTQSLERSTQNVNGTVVYPGETVSISTLMGPRTAEGGYGTAHGYVGTRTVDMVGAGICQTASTIYCAALYAELDIVERHQHGKLVGYMPDSMDATIYAGDEDNYNNPIKDLKIANPYDYPIYIEVKASKGKQIATIYGKETRPSNRKVDYVTERLEQEWPTVEETREEPGWPLGHREETQEPYPRVVSTVTKVVTVDGVEKERTVLHKDKYKMANREWTVGTNPNLCFSPDGSGTIVTLEQAAQIQAQMDAAAGQQAPPAEQP